MPSEPYLSTAWQARVEALLGAPAGAAQEGAGLRYVVVPAPEAGAPLHHLAFGLDGRLLAWAPGPAPDPVLAFGGAGRRADVLGLARAEQGVVDDATVAVGAGDLVTSLLGVEAPGGIVSSELGAEAVDLVCLVRATRPGGPPIEARLRLEAGTLGHDAQDAAPDVVVEAPYEQAVALLHLGLGLDRLAAQGAVVAGDADALSALGGVLSGARVGPPPRLRVLELVRFEWLCRANRPLLEAVAALTVPVEEP